MKRARGSTATIGACIRNSGRNRLSLTDMDEITNPVVRRAVSQTIKVINAVVRTYGRRMWCASSLAREMSRTFDERRKMEKRSG